MAIEKNVVNRVRGFTIFSNIVDVIFVLVLSKIL